MDDAILGRTVELMTRDALDGIGAPVGTDIGEDLCGIGEQISEEHRQGVEGIVLRSHKTRHADAVPVEGAI